MALQHASLELQTKLAKPQVPGRKKKPLRLLYWYGGNYGQTF